MTDTDLSWEELADGELAHDPARARHAWTELCACDPAGQHECDAAS